MRLLLAKQKYKGQKLKCTKNLSDSLNLVMENVMSKRCILNQRKNSLEKQMIIFSTIQTQNPTYSFKIEVEVNFSELLVIYKASLLKNSQIFSINSKELRINFLQAFIKKTFNIEKQYSLRVDKENGQIQLFNKIAYSKRLFQSTSQLLKEVQFRAKELIEVSLKSLNSILFKINEMTRKTQEYKKLKNKELQKIKRHIYFSCYDLGLSQKASEYRYPKEQVLKKREKIIKNLLGKVQRKDDPHQAQLYGLIATTDITDNKQWRKQFESDQYFQYLLQIPTLKATNNENTYIYNQIQIEMPEKVVFQDFLNMNNTKLKIMQAPITYLFNKQKSSLKKESKKQFFTKVLLIKQAKSQNPRHKAKILHEKNIVKHFQFAYSPYLFKYYNCNQNSFEQKNSLLMDYSPFSTTLLNHLSFRKESLSIQSKLNILSHISNGIRFFAYYKVVHMDLSLNNILMVDGYLPKIIDFGESYNREVIQKYPNIPYLPGYSIPYCSPEVFTQNEFTTSQDMYSFGIILFRILLNALPLSSSDEMIALYKNKVYHERLFFCPQKLKLICQEQVCFLLMQIINICLRTEQEGRPLPIWSTIVLKQIIGSLL